MISKKDAKVDPTAAAVNWEGIARFLGQPISRVREIELEPAVTPVAPNKR